MSIIKAIWAEELERARRVYVLCQEKLEEYPKGSLKIKKIRGREVHYLVWREGSKVKSKYIGNNPEVLKLLKKEINIRDSYIEAQERRRIDIILLEKALHLKVEGKKKWSRTSNA